MAKDKRSKEKGKTVVSTEGRWARVLDLKNRKPGQKLESDPGSTNHRFRVTNWKATAINESSHHD
jgi:hypothetical protein